MTRWRPLPHSLPGEARHLVEQLRALKDRSGLSLAELARRTAYSKSSWQRYLSGAQPPPRAAVQALGRAAGADQARLLALWELSARSEPYAGRPPYGNEASPAPAPVSVPPLEHRRWRAVALIAFVVIAVLLAGLLWALPVGPG
jgi:transcriptional regulator with XRE-family HTH domain